MATKHARHRAPRVTGGVDGNARLTSSLAAMLLVVLALEGLTTLQIGPLLIEHVFIGVILIPPIMVKIGSTSWRFFKYYSGDRDYQHKGPPPMMLRLLGPIVVVLTVVMFASGVGLIMLPHSTRQSLFFVHRASFVLWFIAMTVHVLGHLVETAQLAPRDWMARTKRTVAHSSRRQLLEVSSLVLGVLLALVLTPYAYGWFPQG